MDGQRALSSNPTGAFAQLRIMDAGVERNEPRAEEPSRMLPPSAQRNTLKRGLQHSPRAVRRPALAFLGGGGPVRKKQPTPGAAVEITDKLIP